MVLVIGEVAMERNVAGQGLRKSQFDGNPSWPDRALLL
jgi:hypothetical protein